MRIPERFLLSAILVALVSGLLWTGWTWQLDQFFYDWKIRNSTRPPSSEILIVAIDEQSLDEMGRWPWSRSVHAQLVQKLSAAGARVVGLDILFSEAAVGDLKGDRALVDSVSASARVVLPVANTEYRLGGQLVEALPLVDLVDAAAALGHVDRQLDPDAIVRSTYLKAGLRTPRWPSFALAMLSVAYPQRSPDLPGLRGPPQSAGSPLVWVRDYQIWIPFAGPPGTIPRLSYVDVIKDRLPPELFTDALVIVGATAVGLGDLLPTPVSGNSHPMPGVEIVANELDVLLQGLAIRPLAPAWWWCIAVIFVLMPTLMYPRIPRWSLLVWGGFIVLNIAFSMALLQLTRLWYAPAGALVLQLISYPLWSWRRVVQMVVYLNRALQTLHAERVVPEAISGLPLAQSMSFLGCIMPLRGAVVVDASHRVFDQWQDAPTVHDFDAVTGGQWHVDGSDAWLRIPGDPHDRFLGVRWKGEVMPDEDLLKLLAPVVLSLQAPAANPPRNVAEYIQRRIEQVQVSTEKIQFMRRFVTGTLSEMGQGVVVTDGVGHVMLANAEAEKYFGLGDHESLQNREITEYLLKLEISGNQTWPEVLRTVMVEDKPIELSARTPNGLDLLVQLSPFVYNIDMIQGLLLSLADISVLRESERQRRELTAFISHDLRSPLSSIIAITGIARADPQRIGMEMLERIETHAYKTLGLADDFLEFNRAQTAEWKNFQIVNLAAVAHQAADSVSAQAFAKDIRVLREIPDEVDIMGDTGLLERAVINLLENAIKYSPSGTKITLAVAVTGQAVLCTVEDTGYGIARHDIDRIFDKYQRTGGQQQGKQRGLGLGLSFVRVCMERHRGRVDVESEIDRGSRFTLTFPLGDH